MIVKPCSHGPHRDLGGFFDRISVHARANRRKTDGLNVAFGSQLKAVEVAGLKECWLTMLAIPVHGPDRVKHVFGRQPSRTRHNGLTCVTAANASPDFIELAHDLWTASPVNRSIYPATPGQL
jgi:hypothetical protein